MISGEERVGIFQTLKSSRWRLGKATYGLQVPRSKSLVRVGTERCPGRSARLTVRLSPHSRQRETWSTLPGLPMQRTTANPAPFLLLWSLFFSFPFPSISCSLPSDSIGQHNECGPAVSKNFKGYRKFCVPLVLGRFVSKCYDMCALLSIHPTWTCKIYNGQLSHYSSTLPSGT